jgi:ABC-type hemin transport system substrate-binding protein
VCTPRLSVGLILALSALPSQARAQGPKINVIGELKRLVAIGGESTGWVVQLESEMSIDGREAASVEAEYNNTRKLELLENKRVEARGVLSHRQGVERGERTVLVVSSIRKAKTVTQTQAGVAALLPRFESAPARESLWHRCSP